MRVTSGIAAAFATHLALVPPPHRAPHVRAVAAVEQPPLETEPPPILPSPPPPPLPTLSRAEAIAAAKSDGPYESLRGVYDRDELVRFFLQRPMALFNRFVVFAKAYNDLKILKEREAALPPEQRTFGVRLREKLAELGPVAVKLGQTLSQRPDIIGEDVCEMLKSLQTANTAFEVRRGSLFFFS